MKNTIYGGTVATPTPIVNVDNKVDKVEVSNNFANVIKGTAEGEVITLNDVSPIEHNLDVKVKAYNKTLTRGEQIPITTYLVCGFGGSYESNGVTHNVDADGTIRTSGIYDDSNYYMPFMIYCPPYMLEDCSYRLTEGATYEFRCLNEKSTNCYAEIDIVGGEGSVFATYRDEGDGVIFTVPDEPPASGAYYLAVMICFKQSGFDTAGLTFNPKFYNYVVTVEEVEPVGVSVEVCGKNLLSVNNAELVQYKMFNIERIPAGTYIFSGYAISDDTSSSQVGIHFVDDNNVTVLQKLNIPRKSNFSYAITFDRDVVGMGLYSSHNYNYAAGDTSIWSNLQIEVGNKKTGFEEYKEPIIYTPSADGTVDGVKNISPSMTIFTDSDDCVLNVGYNIDTKRYIDKKFAELQALLLEV